MRHSFHIFFFFVVCFGLCAWQRVGTIESPPEAFSFFFFRFCLRCNLIPLALWDLHSARGTNEWPKHLEFVTSHFSVIDSRWRLKCFWCERKCIGTFRIKIAFILRCCCVSKLEWLARDIVRKMWLCIHTKRTRTLFRCLFRRFFAQIFLQASARANKWSRGDAYSFQTTSQWRRMRFQLANEKSIQSQIIYIFLATAGATEYFGSVFTMPCASVRFLLIFKCFACVWQPSMACWNCIDAGEKWIQKITKKVDSSCSFVSVNKWNFFN